MKTRIFWGAFALLALAMLCLLTYSVYQQWRVYAKGSIVPVTIRSLPNSLATSGTIKFEYQNKVYSKSIHGNAGSYLHVGDTIQMRHLEGNTLFLYTNDNPIGWGIFVLLMMAVCLIAFTYYALKRDPPSAKILGKKVV